MHHTSLKAPKHTGFDASWIYYASRRTTDGEGGQESGPQPDVRFSGDFGSVSSIHSAEGGHPPIRAVPRQAQSGGADDRGFGHGRGAPSVSNPDSHSVPGPSTSVFNPVGLEATPSFLRPGAYARRGVGVGGGVPLPPRYERRNFESGTAGRTIEAYGPVGRTSGASSICLLYTSPSPRDRQKTRMPSSA